MAPPGTTLPPTARPEPTAPFDPNADVVQSLDLEWCELHFPAPRDKQVADLLRRCDGVRAIDAIASELTWSMNFTVALTTALYVRGAVVDRAHECVPAQLYQAHQVAVGRTARARMSQTADLLGANPHRRLLIGSLVETYHFVAAASYHIGAAVAQSTCGPIREGISALFVSEWNHSHGLRKGLLRTGLTNDALQHCQPLPETWGVINFLHGLASTDLQAYGICAAINESPKSDTAIKESWDAIARLGLVDPDAIEPFKGHELEDEASNHADIAAVIFSDQQSIGSERQLAIERSVGIFLAVQTLCYEGIKRFYGSPEGPSLWEPDPLV